MKVYNNLIELIGNTPLLRLSAFSKAEGLPAPLIGKLEYFNPLGSVKDRIGEAMIADAEARGVLKPGGVIIEPTSGNTGVGLAFAAAIKGYRLILTMPDSMSVERRMLLSALGAEIVLTDAASSMAGSIAKAKQLAEEIPGAFMPMQFDNPANPEAHRRTTAEELWRDTEGKIDIFVAGVGSGGTITGVGDGLKSKNSAVQIIAVEPAASPVLSGGAPGPHGLQGIGAGFVPGVLNRSVIDEIITITNEDAYATCRLLAKTEGLLVGITSGAAVHAGTVLARRKENTGKNIVVLLPDTGERYLSTGLYES